MALVEHSMWTELVSAAADGQLDVAEQAQLDGHLVGCAECRTLLAGYEHQRRALRLTPPTDHSSLVATVVAERTRVRDTTRALRRQLLARTAIAFGSMAMIAGLLLAITVGQAPAQQPPALAASAVTIDAQGEAFDTTALHVKAGTTVDWQNSGATTHQLVRRLGGATVADELAPGQTESVTFAEPGTYVFYCEIHDGMNGTITVDA